jgi:hypothetical protein
MHRVYFHCTGPSAVVVDQLGTVAENFRDVQARAAAIVTALMADSVSQDWRDWMVHVSDEDGDDMFTMPFSSVMARLH